MLPHLDNRDRPPTHPPSRRVSKLYFFPQNGTSTPSMKGKSTVDAPSSGRQRAGIGTPSMKGKSTIGAPSMKGKSVDLPKEGKREEITSISINFSREKFGD